MLAIGSWLIPGGMPPTPPPEPRNPLSRAKQPAAEVGRILVVEDEAILGLELQDLLAELGFLVVGLEAGAPEAVAAAERIRPDIVLMDIRLARRTDGIAAAGEIYERFGIRSVFLTAHTDAATLARARRTEPLGFVAKPFTPRVLASTLCRALACVRTRH